MQYRIVVASSKGGVGKSTSSALLAVSLALAGKRVLLLDLDLGTRCLDMFFDAQSDSVYDIGDVYLDRIEPARAFVRLAGAGCGIFDFVASSMSLRANEVEPDRLCAAVDSLAKESEADFVICDTAGLVVPTMLAKWANLGIICSTQMPASVRSAEATAIALRDAGLSTLRLLVTAFDYREAKSGVRSGLISMIDGSSLRVLGVIPYDRDLMIAQEHGSLPPERSVASIAFSNVAARLCGEDRRLFEGIPRMKGKKVL